MKKTGLIALLITLVILEIFLCTGFLPSEWQHAIDGKLPKIYGDPMPIAHPNLDREIEDALRQNIGLRVGLDLIVLSILAVNALFIRLVWRQLRRREMLSADRS